MLRVVAHILMATGFIAQVGLGIWAFIVELQIIYDALGLLGVIVGLVLFPFTFFLAPFYALLADGNWFPLLLVYGGAIPGHVVMHVGQWMLFNSDYPDWDTT